MLPAEKEPARPGSGITRVRRWWVDVSLQRLSARIELRKLVAVRVLGQDVVRLDDVWAAAHLGGAPLRALAFDFVGEDGSRLGDLQPGGVPGQELATGYVCSATRDLLWQPTPARPAFWQMKGVARIVASPVAR